ncbi:MAG: diaminopimelate epimerase [Pseudomonadota bacterium]
MKLAFHKYVGAGNDFLFLSDDPNLSNTQKKQIAIELCDRHWGVGADGIAFFKKLSSSENRFEWDFWNSDGSHAEMCGNAARCSMVYFKKLYDADRSELLTKAGLVSGGPSDEPLTAFVQWDLSETSLEGKDVELRGGLSISGFFIDTGVPHFVVPGRGDQLSHSQLLEIQEHDEFRPRQTNVTLLDTIDGKHHSKSFERGVQDITLACGTGLVASACVLQAQTGERSFDLRAPGGDLCVSLLDNNRIELKGPAVPVFQGEFEVKNV